MKSLIPARERFQLRVALPPSFPCPAPLPRLPLPVAPLSPCVPHAATAILPNLYSTYSIATSAAAWRHFHHVRSPHQNTFLQKLYTSIAEQEAGWIWEGV